MLDFIAQYWLECVLGLIASGFGILCRYFYSLYKKEKQSQAQTKEDHIIKILKDYVDETNKHYTEKDEKLETEIAILKNGMLSLQGAQFKAECKALLEKDHIITPEEYNNVCIEHSIYNGLGGNHEGDYLFSLVEEKIKTQIVVNK